MPVDVEARVISNTRLSPDYNVIALAAPEIAAATSPGQFVMVKPGRGGSTPFLRRPFSVFEILRSDGRVVGLTLLSKRIGTTTQMLFDAVEGDVVSCLGPLGRAFSTVHPAAEAWMVAGGVGLAPFATLTEVLLERNARTTLFYGARSTRDLFYLDWFRDRGVRLVLATEDGTVGDCGRVTLPLERELRSAVAGTLPPSHKASADHRAGSQAKRRPAVLGASHSDATGGGGQVSGAHSVRDLMIYACGPEPMLEAVAHLASRYDRPLEISVERVMGCGLGGCYSCVIPVRNGPKGHHYVRSCLAGPVFDGAEIVWD
jgi:dihydroorotate dehydrogenase electron transfer subunit